MSNPQQEGRMQIALLSLDGQVRQWQLSAVRAVQSAFKAASAVKLELMVLRPGQARRQEQGLWPLVRAVDQRLLGPRPSLWQSVAVGDEFEIACNSGSSEPVDGASEPDQPYLVLDCTGLEDTQAWAARARLGLLRVRFGDGFNGTGIDRALVESRPWLRVSVELVAPNQTHLIETTVMTLTRSRSFSRAREAAGRRARQLLIRAITRLHQGRGDIVATPADPSSIQLETPRRHGTPACPSGGRGLALLLKVGVNLAVGAARSALLHLDHWFLAYRTQQDKFIANGFEMSSQGANFLIDPDRFFADPCVFEHEGADHVFFEDFSYRKKKGVISWSQLQSDGTLSQPSVVLEEQTHLSYPFVFSYQGSVYMIPETIKQRELALYEALDFPRRWRKGIVLLENLEASDATLHVHDDRWWMFVNIRYDGFSASDELVLFYARGPFGPWTAHPRNPIKSDIRSARPAGRLFYLGNRLIRPAQDCSSTYGGALVLCEVQELTTSGYREAVLKRLDPGWLAGNRGFHTLSFSNRLEVIDGKFDLPRWRGRSREPRGRTGALMRPH
jgi:hypothetical protein